MAVGDKQAFQSPVPDYQLSLEEQQSILDIQYSVLEMVASNKPAQEVLVNLCSMAESLLPNSLSSIMLLQEHGGLEVLCAPNIPPEGKRRLNDLQPGPSGGSCANAVYHNEPVFVTDAQTDDRCIDTQELFKHYELHACWSTPIRDDKGHPIGSFALSSFETRSPSNFFKQLLAISAHIIGIILQRSKQQEQLKFMAFNDPLTGLFNRASLFAQLETAITEAHQKSDGFALLFLDLDRFKNINDAFGHTVGDGILTLIAQRLQSQIKDLALLYRVGGDEFVLLVDHLQVASDVASQVINALNHPLEYGSQRFLIDGSIGIARYPNDGVSAEALLKNADTAMYHAKKNGLNFSYYKPELGLEAQRAFTIENDLHTALHRNEFQLYYQTKVSGQTHKTEGLEVLLRWVSEAKGVINPADFIPFAEQTGLIIPIGEWVMRNALKHAEQLKQQLNESFNLAINISGAQLTDDHIDRILAIINSSSFPNEQIELEITETALVQEADSSSAQLEKIRKAGVKLAIDDFGIGYSSLAYLKRFHVNSLKIDRLLIKDITQNPDDLAITKAVIALSKSLGLQVVAEGVETQEQATLLGDLECDLLQGNWFCKPKPFNILNLKQSLILQ